MTKRDNPKKRDDLHNLYGTKALTVGELIALLKTYPEDWMATGYTVHEDTDFVTCRSVRVKEEADVYDNLRVSPLGGYYTGGFVDIMGTLR